MSYRFMLGALWALLIACGDPSPRQRGPQPLSPDSLDLSQGLPDTAALRAALVARQAAFAQAEDRLPRVSISTAGWDFTESETWYFAVATGETPQPQFLHRRSENEYLRREELYFFEEGRVQAWEKKREFLALPEPVVEVEGVARALGLLCGWTYRSGSEPLQVHDAAYGRQVATFEQEKLAYALAKTRTCVRQLEAAGLAENGPNAMYNSFTLQADRPPGKQDQEPPMDTYFISPELYSFVLDAP